VPRPAPAAGQLVASQVTPKNLGSPSKIENFAFSKTVYCVFSSLKKKHVFLLLGFFFKKMLAMVVTKKKETFS
jgi:hypothetical protein